MFEGVTDWRAVSEYWQRCRTMGVQDATQVGDAVFAPLMLSTTPEDDDTTEPRERRCGDRLETWQEFHRRLDREATRVEGQDAAAERERRRRARQMRDTRAEISDDGLGTLFVTAGTVSVVASIERIETIARRARKAGDKRSLAHIRSDTTLALLVHGVLPISALFGHSFPAAESASTGGGNVAESVAGVAEIPGHGWLSPAHARELALSPGAVLHRLLTDPADGRLVERTTTAYRPDAAMRAQVHALDRSCRAPGCTMPAHRCELDHEIPFGTPNGTTSETNLNPKHSRHHQLKTEQFWTSAMDSTRTVTWTTLLSRMYPTYAHDYREYGGAALQDGSGDGGSGDGGASFKVATLDSPFAVASDDADLRDQLIYAALSTREGQDQWLEAMDDDPEHPDGQWSGVPLSLFHRESGRRRHGPPLHQASVKHLLSDDPTPEARVIKPSPVAPAGPPPL